MVTMEDMERARYAGNDKSAPTYDQICKPKQFPTPTTQDAKNNGTPSQMERNTKPLNAEVGGSLNPTWVEWLMGWPLMWTSTEPMPQGTWIAWQRTFRVVLIDSVALETVKSQPPCNSLGKSLVEDSDEKSIPVILTKEEAEAVEWMLNHFQILLRALAKIKGGSADHGV
jgi:hypothetical protein